MHALIGVLNVAALVATGCATGQRTTIGPEPASVFNEVWSLVNEHFFDPAFNGVDWAAARTRYAVDPRMEAGPDGRTAVIREMLALLNTSHTSYHTPDDRAYYDLLGIFADPLSEFVMERFGDDGVRYEGVGVVTKLVDGRWHVIDVFTGTPAAKGGLLVGDEIVEVDGRPYEEIASFRGRAGDDVRLTIQRSHSVDSRQTIRMPVIWIEPMTRYEWSIRTDARVIHHEGALVAYVRIRNYASPVMHDMLESLVTNTGPFSSADALVLDIRGGWGGANPGYLDLFNKRIPKLTYLSRDGERTALDDRWRKPVVLLVDGGTRSGKEVLAHGFKLHGIGTVVGQRTAGAVTGGRPFILSDGSLLFLAVADVLVDGIRLEGRGVEPDLAVEFYFPYSAGADPQMDRAIEVAAADVAKLSARDTTRD